ncbi:hypothetical protein AMTRI_Chr05g57610 [Amborella trichopoda]
MAFWSNKFLEPFLSGLLRNSIVILQYCVHILIPNILQYEDWDTVCGYHIVSAPK